MPTLEQTIGSVYVIPKAEKIVADRIDILDDIAREEVLKEEYANAAIWYLRGLENLNRIADDQLVAVHKFLSDPKKIKIESELAQAFDQVQKALDVFREGSLIHRCDFSLARMIAVLKYGERRNDLVLIPTYIPGMYEAMRLLHADAKRLLHAGDIGSSVDRLATCYRMVSHLGTDPLLVSSLTSHKVFKDAMLLSEVVLAHDNWDEKHRPELAKALDRMSRKDPCGYIESILKARKGLAKAFRFWLKGMTSSDIDKNKRALRKWNGDQLLYGLIILNALKAKDVQPKIDTEPGGKAVSPGNAPVAKDAQEELAEQLAEILSLEGLKQAKAQAESDVPLLMTGGLDAMLELPIPAIGAVEECKSAARRDLRKARSLLEPL